MPRKKDTCACGRPKVSTSVQCRTCNGIRRRKTPRGQRRVDCPVCGGPMLITSKTCVKCQTDNNRRKQSFAIDRSRLTDAWLSEFCGLFFGEGSAMIVRNNRSFSVWLLLRLRDDDEPMVQEIIDILGGRTFRRPPAGTHGGQIEWQTDHREHVAEICELILSHSVLPAKKRRDIEQVLDFCRWRDGQPLHFSEEVRQEAERRYQALRDSRKYPSC